MSNTVDFVSRDAQLKENIRERISALRSAKPLALPKPDDRIVQYYIQRIEGTYDVGRAKKDTDNAIDLLYIAYNTTPQAEGEIRVRIGALMDRLIKSQQESERTMRAAMRTADTILTSLKNLLPDWLDVKDDRDIEQIKAFARDELIDLAKEIKDRALAVGKALQAIADTYDGIIKDTTAATAESEKALGARLKDKAAIEKEINEANAKREQLQSLVSDLQAEVEKFDKRAREYEARANTAEERAFIMSIVRIGAQMVSSAIPAIAMAAGGPGSILAASTLSTANRATGDKSGAGQEGGDKSDNTADIIKTKTAISEKKSEIAKSEVVVTALKKKTKELEADLVKEKKKSEGGTLAAGLEKRIAETKEELRQEEEKSTKLIAALAGLQASLDALDKGLGKLTDEQQQQAANLREMQMKMLDKVEAYEKEKRTQSAELVKINALLKGQRSQEETIQLAIKSLNLSLSALKRTKEIVQEIAAFFKSFADFMDDVTAEAAEQIRLLESAVAKKTIGENSLNNLILSIDDFFISQTGEWNATNIVSDKFNKNFADGWSKLNKLSGTYITGDQLDSYLKKASLTLEAIVEEREESSKQRLLALDDYRRQLLG